MKKMTTCCILIFVGFLLFGPFASAGEVSNPHPLKDLSFLEYHVVDSTMDINTNVRNVKIEVKNISDYVLTNVIAKIDSAPEYVGYSDNVVAFESIAPGASAISADSVQVSIDMNQMQGTDLKLIWLVEYEKEGEYFMNETAVVETIE
jgi:hypothetical protein